VKQKKDVFEDTSPEQNPFHRTQSMKQQMIGKGQAKGILPSWMDRKQRSQQGKTAPFKKSSSAKRKRKGGWKHKYDK